MRVLSTIAAGLLATAALAQSNPQGSSPQGSSPQGSNPLGNASAPPIGTTTQPASANAPAKGNVVSLDDATNATAGTTVVPPVAASAKKSPAKTSTAPQERSFEFLPEHVADIAWRNLGPSNMGGRITDIEVVPGSSTQWYLATGGGGLLKTTNKGTTWTHLFQDQPVASIGDVAVAPSDPEIVWVGTGEKNARNSVQWGDGVYRSTDGGKTFEHMGLEKTFQIGRVAVHPRDPDVVFVGALGELWADNEDRGVYRTRDGGKSWDRVLYLDQQTGCIDVRIDPRSPSTVYAVMYERKRDMFDSNDPAVRFGARSGLFRSDDGGDTWKHLTRGLPTCKWGRAGLSLWQKNPNTVFLIVETERSGWATGTKKTASRSASPTGNAYMGIQGRNADQDGATLTVITNGGPSAKAGLKAGDVVTKVGDQPVKTYRELTTIIRSSKGGSNATIEYRRGEVTATAEITWGTRATRRGSSNAAPFGNRLGGQRPNIQDRQKDDKAYETGGIFRSDDRGETWRRINSLTDRPFYYSVIAVDPSDDKHIYSVGTSLYASHDGGKKFAATNRGIHVDFHALWVDPANGNHILAGCDGGINESFDRGKTWEVLNGFAIGQFYHADVDTSVPYRVYGGLQDNGTWAGASRNGWRDGSRKGDWVTIYGGDGFRAHADPTDPSLIYATSQLGNMGCVNLKTGVQHRISKPRGSYNWDTPFFLSPHNPKLLYYAGTHVGRTWNADQSSRQRSEQLTTEVLGRTSRGTATAMTESPVKPGVLYVGTDDGALWRTKDDGSTWQSIYDNVGLPKPVYCSSLEASHFEEGRVYATFDGHRSAEFGSHVYVSDDYGDTWAFLIGNLPDEPVHICREDPADEDLLYLGTEFGCYASLDRGDTWQRLGRGLPTVAVRDLAIQDRDSEMVAATHGRGLFAVDIEPLRQMNDTFTPRDGDGDSTKRRVLQKPVHMFEAKDAILWQMRSRSVSGHKEFRVQNPPLGTTVYVHFSEAPKKAPKVVIKDIAGKTVGSIRGKARAGLQRFVWNAEGRRRQRAQPGAYSASINSADGEIVETQTFRLLPDPLHTRNSGGNR